MHSMDFKPPVTRLAIVNPRACVPFFIRSTPGLSNALRQRTLLV
jgi:multiple antibiotic resistance protein